MKGSSELRAMGYFLEIAVLLIQETLSHLSLAHFPDCLAISLSILGQ